MIDIQIRHKDFNPVTGLINGITRSMPKGTLDALEIFRSKVTKAIIKNLSGEVLVRRSGLMINVFKSGQGLTKPARTPSGYEIHISRSAATQVPYMGVQEEGGVVKAQGEWMTIPIGVNLNRKTGHPKIPAPEFINQYEGRTFTKKYSANKAIMFLRPLRSKGSKGSETKPIPYFLLKKSVKLSRTNWLSSAVQEEIDHLPSYIRSAYEEVLNADGDIRRVKYVAGSRVRV